MQGFVGEGEDFEGDPMGNREPVEVFEDWGDVVPGFCVSYQHGSGQNMLALCKCMYTFIIGNQLITQNNDKYCPETLTGTAFSIKKICSNHNMENSSPTGNNSCQCAHQTACDYHKVGMSVKRRLVGTHRTHFHSHILRLEVKGPLCKLPPQFFHAKI